jgi:DNA-binding XRE family transcriptional regulator
MMLNTEIDFTKVEQLRKHMLLTASDMAKVLSVTRMTYYSWVKGAKPRKDAVENIRATLKRLLAIMVEHKWPMPEVIAMEQRQRKQKLDELLELIK